MSEFEGKIQECTGCGFCCTKTKCAAGNRLYPSADICPALIWDGKRHTCDLMNLPGMLGETYRKELYAGEGCCANLNSWRYEPLQDRTKGAIDPYANPVPAIMQKFLGILGKQMITGDQMALIIIGFIKELEKGGMPQKEAIHIGDKCMSYIKTQRSSFIESFMG